MSQKYKISFTITVILLLVLSSSLSISAVEKFKKDIIVYSAEPEGITAAVAAARDGKKVVLIMTRENPGGLMTYGALNFLDLNYDNNSNNINHGIFEEWHKKVGSSISFSPQKAENIFQKMLKAEKNIKIINSAKIKKIIIKEERINKLIVKSKGKEYQLSADFFIDASQDGDLAFLADEDYFIGTADIGLENKWMASTQILKFSHVNPRKLKTAVENNKYKNSYFKDDHAWGFSNFSKAYQSKNPFMRLRGLNIVFIKNKDSYDAYINALLLFDVNPLSEPSLKKAKLEAAKEAEFVLKYLQKNLAGFKKAELAELPSELYKRESRHFLNHYQLNVKDLFRQKIFKDTITLASYPLDYQASAPDYPGFVLFNPEYYAIPLRALIARQNKNLLIVGRSSGYSSLAAASARVLPVGMNTAEAAALAASEAINKEKSLLSITNDRDSLNKIRSELKINLDKLKQESPIIKDQQLLKALEKLLSWGITIGGYKNNFNLNSTPSEKEFTAVILKIMQKKEAKNLYEWVPGSLETLSSSQKLSTKNALKLLLAAESQKVLEMKSENYYSKTLARNLLNKEAAEFMQENKMMSRKEMIILAASYLDSFPTPAKLKFIRGEYFD